MRRYFRGTDFPNEGFVQKATEDFFRRQGFEVDVDQRVDLLCVHAGKGETWHVEAKGETTQVGLDFRTGLGQLLQGMSDRGSRYGMAVPDIPKFRDQINNVSPWVTELLGIHWLLVKGDGAVEVLSPSGTLHDRRPSEVGSASTEQ